MQKKNKIQTKVVLAAVDQKTDRLDIYGDIGNPWSDDSINLKQVTELLNQSQGTMLEVHINSFGGDAFMGIAIFNALKQTGKKITTYIDGVAASAASVIAMAGDTIIMPMNTHLIIHNPMTFVSGNYNDLRKTADELEKLSGSYRATYMLHFKGTDDELQSLLDDDTDLTAQEAVDLGLADEVVNYSSNSTGEEEETPKEQVLAKYRNSKPAASVKGQAPKNTMAMKLANLLKENPK